MSIKKLKAVYWDIETVQNLVAVFSLDNKNWIDPSAIVQESYIVCACWNVEGEDKIHSVSVLDDPKRYAKNPHDDYHVVKTLHEVMQDTDLIIHHNGNSFDKPWLDTRILYHGLSPLPPTQAVDTYRVAKSRFRFNSNKLDYIARQLKIGKKKSTTPGLWMRVLRGDVAAIKEMVAYNKVDVSILKGVFKKLQPYVANHINRELFGHVGCPRCGSKKVQSRGTYYAQTRTYRRFQCQGECKGWFRQLKADKNSGTPSRVQ